MVSDYQRKLRKRLRSRSKSQKRRDKAARQKEMQNSTSTSVKTGITSTKKKGKITSQTFNAKDIQKEKNIPKTPPKLIQQAPQQAAQKSQVEVKNVSPEEFEKQFKDTPGFIPGEDTSGTIPDTAQEPVTESLPYWKTGFDDDGVRYEPDPVPTSVKIAMGAVTALGVATGISAAAAAYTAVTSEVASVGTGLVSSRGLSAPIIAKAAQGGQGLVRLGKTGTGGITALGSLAKKTAPKIGQVAMNTKTASKVMSIISKIAAPYKNPMLIAGALGGYAFSVDFSFNEGMGDVTTTYDILHRDLINDGDIKGAAEVKEKIDEVYSAANIIKNFIPIANFILADYRKIQASKYASEKRTANALRGEFTPTPLTTAMRDESDAYYADIEKRKALAKKADRKEEADYYQQILDDKAEAKAKERKEDAAYWDKVRADNQQATEEAKTAEDDYVPKWNKTSDGKFTPNLANPNWVKEDGKNVWKGQ